MSYSSGTSKRSQSPYDNAPKNLIGEIGFYNLGNTCYINVTLQILLNCKYFTQFLEALPPQHLREKSEVIQSLTKLYNSLKDGTYATKYLRDFRDTIHQELPFFEPNMEHDAGEFLNALIDKLGEEIHKGDWQDKYRGLFSFTTSFDQICPSCQSKSKKYPQKSQEYINFFLTFNSEMNPSENFPVYVPFFFENIHSKNINYEKFVEIPAQKLQKNLDKKNILPVQISDYGFDKKSICSDEYDIKNSNFILELPKKPTPMVPNYPDNCLSKKCSFKDSKVQLELVVVNVDHQRHSEVNLPYSLRRFTIPFVINVESTISAQDLIILVIENLIVLSKRSVGIPQESLRSSIEIGIYNQQNEFIIVDKLSIRPLSNMKPQWNLNRKYGSVTVIWPSDNEYTRQLKKSLINLPNDVLSRTMAGLQIQAEKKLELEWMMNEYFNEQIIDRKCDTCKRQIRPKPIIQSFPNILIVMIMRFVPVKNKKRRNTNTLELSAEKNQFVRMSSYDSSNLELSIEKNNSFIHYPITDLDMTPFVDKTVEKYSYNLIGVINHESDSVSTGHYTAFCHNFTRDAWIKCNDDVMSLIREDTVSSKYAYILIYSRNEAPCPIIRRPTSIDKAHESDEKEKETKATYFGDNALNGNFFRSRTSDSAKLDHAKTFERLPRYTSLNKQDQQPSNYKTKTTHLSEI